MIKRLLLTIFALLIPALVFGAAISTLTDNFNDNSIDAAKWTGDDGLEETNGQWEFTTTTAGRYVAPYSVNTYDLTGSQATIKLVDAGNQTLASYAFKPLYLWLNSNNDIRWLITGGNIFAYKKVGGSASTPWSTTYVADTFRYLKIRESSGTIYWDYSATGLDGSWTNAYSATVASLFAVTALEVDFEQNSGAELSTTTAKVDDFNILPSATRRIIFCQ